MVLVDWQACELLGFKGTASNLLALTNPAAPPPGSVIRTMRGALNMKRMALSASGEDASKRGDESRPSLGELTLSGDEPVLQVDLRVFLDGSSIELFTSTGHTLSTRLHMLEDGDRGMHLVSIGGTSGFAGKAWQMNSIWPKGETPEVKPAA